MKNDSPKITLIKGAVWAVGTRWAIKLVGFLNTVIMARLILPSDYGIVAMATLFVGLIYAFTDVGAETAIVRIEDPSVDEIDSAWTLRLLQSLGVSVLMVLTAPLAASYFNEPRVLSVLLMLALFMAINGANNIGLTLAHKAFQFSMFFRVNVISKVISVAVTLISGLYFRDYRALVFGIGAGYFSGVVLSYTMHPYRPKFNTKKIKEIWHITKWLMVSSIGNFLLRRSDEVLASRIAGTSDFGIYHVGADLGRLPVSELGPAMMRAFLPVLSSLQGDKERVNAAVLKTLSALNVLTLPVGFGVAAIALPLTHIILGEKWIDAAPFVAIYAVVSAVQFISSPLTTLLILEGHAKIQSTAIWIEFGAFIIAAYFLLPAYGLIGLALARMIASTVNTCLTAYFSHKYCSVSIYLMVACVTRPLIGSILMGISVLFFMNQKYDSMYYSLFFGVILGVVLYTFWIVISWLIVGKPEGLESTLLDGYNANKHSKLN